MKRYIACLTVLLTACSSEIERQELPRQEVTETPSSGSPSDGSHTLSCDRPSRYVSVTVDGRTYTFPIFVMCDPYTSDRDLGDPPSDVAANPYWRVIAYYIDGSKETREEK